MAETITPVVHGKRSDYRIAIALHVAAAGVAAAAFGAIAGLLGFLFGAPWGRGGFVFVAALALVYLGRELFGLPIPTFDRKRQVPDWWRTFYGPKTTAALYGAGLGIGFLTFLRHGTFVVVTGAAVATGDPVVGALLAAPFGVARGLTALVARRSTSGEDSSELVAGLEKLAETKGPRIANAAALVVVAGSAVLAL
jgi:hypothetical protein